MEHEAASLAIKSLPRYISGMNAKPAYLFAAGSPLDLVQWKGGDRRCIRTFLDFLPSLYPDADEWLDRRLSDVESGRASCLIARSRAGLEGILIDTDKGGRRRKISTLYLSPRIRAQGIGNLLLSNRRRFWARQRVETTYITVATHCLTNLDRFLSKNGFEKSAICPERYGTGRDEVVYETQVL